MSNSTQPSTGRDTTSGTAPQVRVGVTLEGARNPSQWRRPWDEHYETALEFAEAADQLGVDAIAVSEHHGWDDGYTPRPLMLLSAVAARTSRTRLGTAILIAPFYETVSLAEEAASVDCLSGGRLELGLGLGYRAPEYALFKRTRTATLASYERQIVELRELWNGHSIAPRPVQDPLPLWSGLRGPKGQYLAGRLGLGRLYLQEDHYETYLAGLRDGGHDAEAPRVGGTVAAILSRDPERAFATLAPRIVEHRAGYERYAVEGSGVQAPTPLTAEEYRAIGGFPSLDNASERTVVLGGGVKRAHGFSIWTPEEAATAIRTETAGRPTDIIYFQSGAGGQIDEFSYESIELIENELKPLLAAEAGPLATR